MNEAVMAYAAAYLAYVGGTKYGQGGGVPPHDGLNWAQAERVRVMVGKGRRVGLAMRQRDAGRVLWERFDLTWQRRLWAGAGLPVGAADAVYGMGYRDGNGE
jgi:hypothetical protein